jgi:hypothetical protein
MGNDPNQSESASASSLTGLASKIRSGKKTASQSEYDATPPKISITHRKTFNPELRISSPISILVFLLDKLTRPLLCPPLRIELDGLVIATVAEGEKFDISTQAGPHRLRIRSIIRSSSRELELTNGQRLRFWCLNSLSGVVFQRED